jgi:FAD-dependent oxidoreductase family protein
VAIETRLETLVDIMRVPVVGEPRSALVSVVERSGPIDVSCDVLVVGGGTGGVAAALAAARRGCSVCLVEETDWLGGQLTSQGVAALDEHPHIETFGGTASYYRVRRALRDYYRIASEAAAAPDFNPGDCWVTKLAFEPAVAAAHLKGFIDQAGRVTTYLRTKAAAATVENDLIKSVLTVSLVSPETWRFHPKIVLDATDLGDLLPLSGAEYRHGAESIRETGEPHAQPGTSKPRCVQSYTYTFALERRHRPEYHVIPRPERYSYFRDRQPYSLTIEVHGGEIYSENNGRLSYTLYETMPGTKGSLWTYRRLIAASQFGDRFPADITMINWPGNDYRDAGLIDRPAAGIAAALQDAKRVSLGFLYWLQTEAPADRERIGAPELRLRPDIMGSADGLSKHPYIREGRRIRALKTITEQEVAAEHQRGPRAAHFMDSVGIGWYPIDIHPVVGDVGVSCRTRPFQIPLGALLPVRITNLIAASKNIGTTHITNGCYRLHPVEWNIGESAGSLAAFAIRHRLMPRSVCEDASSLRSFQTSLLAEGIPLAWVIDVPVDDPAFLFVQKLFMDGHVETGAELKFRPEDRITADEWLAWGGQGGELPISRAAAARCLVESSGGRN